MKPVADRFLFQAAWASFGQLVQLVFAVGGLVILVRLLGPAAYGHFAVALVCVGLCEILVGGHAADGMVSVRDLRPAHENALFWSLAALGFACGAGLWLARAPLAGLFGLDEAAAVIGAAAWLPLLTALTTVPGQLLVRDVRFSALSVNSGAAALVATLAGIAAALGGMGVFSLVLMEYVRRILTLVLHLRASRWRPGFGFAAADSLEIIRRAGGRIENRAVQYISAEAMPRGLIGAVLGADMLGIYVVAKRLLDQLNGVLSGPIGAVSLPAVAEFREDGERMRRLVTKAIRASTITYWPALLGLVVVAPVLVPVMLGPGWGTAAPVIQILAVAALRVPLSGFTNAFFAARGEHRIISRLQWISLGLGLAFLVAGLSWGLIGACLALAARQWAAWPFGAVAISRATGVSALEQARVLALAGTVPCLMGACVAALSLILPTSWPDTARLAALTLFGLAAYPAIWMAISPTARGVLPSTLGHMVRGNAAEAVKGLKQLLL